MYQFPVLIEKDEDGYYSYCPSLEGCQTQGDTYEETIENIKEAILSEVEKEQVFKIKTLFSFDAFGR